MEAAVVLLLAGVAFLAVVSPVLTISALVRLTRLEKRVSELASRVERARRGGVAPERPAEPEEPVPPAPATPAPTVTPSPPPPVRPVARAAPRPGPSAEPTADFATNLGPRILVGAGGWIVRRLVAFLLVGLPMASAASAKNDSPPAFEREIRTPGAGLVAVRLDRHVYEAARSDLGDLRVLEESATSVPYTLDRGFPPASPERRPEIRNRGVVPGEAATAVLDFGERVTKTRLALRLSGDNFRRRVVVEGSDDGRSWVTLTDDSWVFAIPGVEPVRYEVVTLPENDFRQLRVTVHPNPRERKRMSIEDAWLPSGAHRARREESLAPQWSRAAVKDSQETWLTIDLGARHQPFQGIVLDVGDERFFREVRVEARKDPVLSASESVAPPDQWRPVGSGMIYRLEQGGELRESLRVDVAGRARVLRLRLRNRDDRPLRVTNVSVLVPVERLLFEAGDGDHTLTYGAPKLTAPTYDLARTLDDEPVTSVATLGPPVRRDVVADILPWTERHPVLLWAGLVMVVAALAAVTWRALRSA